MARSMRKNGAIRKVVKLQIKQRRNRNGNGGKSKTATLALAQGVGQVTRKPFQTRSAATRRILDYFNATLPAHLPLPRAVGPYTIVRTTQVISSASTFNFFNFIASDDAAAVGARWLASCGLGSAVATGAINAAGSTILRPMAGLDPLYTAAMISPAALTVQVMNPNALQTTSGICYLGRSTAQYELAGSTRTWDELGTEFVQFMSPRLCSAGKLALRGVTIDSYPLDMSEVSDFRGIRPFSALGVQPTWTTESIRPAAFAPIVCYNPDNVALQYLVTMEWRVRFDPSNPAAGSHSYHGTAPDSTWDSVTRRAASLGHGAMDIAEKVAEVGAAGMGALETGAIMFA